jgi:N-acetylmuramoyl-L-alanine amidase
MSSHSAADTATVTIVLLNWRLTAPLAAVLVLAACGTGAEAAQGHPASTTARHRASRADRAAKHGVAKHGIAKHGAAPTAQTDAASKPLAGKTIGIDPGHNGRNKDDPAYINKPIWNGREWEPCDTTGTETDGGYTEARYNFNVGTYLREDLQRLGARVVMTRHSNNGVGPCVNRRSQIINRAHASVAIDIHADGGPPTGRGFTVLLPVADGPNNKVIRSSVRFGHDVRAAMLKTRMPESDYYGHDGLIYRNDLAGLNLTRVPKILIETGNMRNATDARLLVQTWFQKRLARAFTAAILQFLGKH